MPTPSSPQAAAPAPPARRRLKAGELDDGILKILTRLPDPFIFSDVYKLLGYQPDRGSLHRALQDMQRLGFVAIVAQGKGSRPMQYRWTGSYAALGS